MEEIRILGRYVPSEFAIDVIQAELRHHLPSCCARERLDVRVPLGLAPHPDNLEWHQDGGGREGSARHCVFWASSHPTHLKTSTGKIVSTAAFDVVWIDNDRAFHRQPRDGDPSRRWFACVRCGGG